MSEVGGGWTVVESAFYDSSLLVGDIDINSHNNMMSMNSQRRNGADDKDTTGGPFTLWLLFTHLSLTSLTLLTSIVSNFNLSITYLYPESNPNPKLT